MINLHHPQWDAEMPSYHAAEPARVLIAATNELPEVAEQVENQQLAVITSDGLRLLPVTAPITQTDKE